MLECSTGFYNMVTMLMWSALSPVFYQHIAAQDVFGSMPLLTHLAIGQELSRHSAQLLSAVRRDKLHSLEVRLDLCHASFLQGCTQLKALTLVYSDKFKGAIAIADLAGLTKLELNANTWWKRRLISAEEQSELGITLAALSNLQSLRLDHAPPGPVSQALSQLTALTEVTLSQQNVVTNPGPLILPSCLQLSLPLGTSMQHLVCIKAPQLRHLDGIQLALKLSDVDALRGLCRGVLRACNSLCLSLQHGWSKKDTVALMAVLSQDWQPIRSSSMDRHQPSRQWSLELCTTPLSRQCLELLPKGLGSLRLQ
jgi:hypothetical protein